MKKKILLNLILFFIGYSGFSQKTTKNPKMGSSKVLGDLIKIELKDDLSTFYFDKKNHDSIISKIKNKLVLTTELDTSKASLLKVDYIKYKGNHENGYSYAIVFPAISEDAKIFNIGLEREFVDSNHVKGKGFVKLLANVEIGSINSNGFQEKIFAKKSFKKTLASAEEKKKNILLYFTAGWCGPCKWMDNYIFSHKDVQSKITSDFVTLKVDVDSQKGEKLRKKYYGDGMPNFFILNSKGEIIKEKVGAMTKSEWLDFLTVDNSVTTKKPKITKYLRKDYGLGLRLGFQNNSIKNLPDTNYRIGMTIDALYSIDYNRRYLLRTGIGFSSKGVDGLRINYLRIPFEFGYSIYKGTLFDLPGAVRLITSPYYAFRLNERAEGLSNDDYGIRFGLSPHIGDFNELELEIFYEHGMNDIFRNVPGQQNNRSFGLSLSLTL